MHAWLRRNDTSTKGYFMTDGQDAQPTPALDTPHAGAAATEFLDGLHGGDQSTWVQCGHFVGGTLNSLVVPGHPARAASQHHRFAHLITARLGDLHGELVDGCRVWLLNRPACGTTGLVPLERLDVPPPERLNILELVCQHSVNS